jgi:hypothetical protein
LGTPYGCAAHRSKGAAICGNALTISEGKLSRAIFGALHELLASHDFRQRFADRFAQRIAARKPAGAEERASLAAEVNAQEGSTPPRHRGVRESSGWAYLLTAKSCMTPFCARRARATS